MSVYKIHITLQDFSLSKISRVVVADGNCTFFDLHYAICQMMGFGGYHLWDFEYRSRDQIQMKILCPQEDESTWDIRWWSMAVPASAIDTYQSIDTTLDQILPQYPKLLYCYDYGDDRRFEIKAQETDDAIHKGTIKCVQTSWGQVIEDCGGVEWLTDRIQLHQAGKWDRESFDTQKEFANALKPYITPYKIWPLKDSRHYHQSIIKMLKDDRHEL
jgi:hypothetical protein